MLLLLFWIDWSKWTASQIRSKAMTFFPQKLKLFFGLLFIVLDKNCSLKVIAMLTKSQIVHAIRAIFACNTTPNIYMFYCSVGVQIQSPVRCDICSHLVIRKLSSSESNQFERWPLVMHKLIIVYEKFHLGLKLGILELLSKGTKALSVKALRLLQVGVSNFIIISF